LHSMEVYLRALTRYFKALGWLRGAGRVVLLPLKDEICLSIASYRNHFLGVKREDEVVVSMFEYNPEKPE